MAASLFFASLRSLSEKLGFASSHRYFQMNPAGNVSHNRRSFRANAGYGTAGGDVMAQLTLSVGGLLPRDRRGAGVRALPRCRAPTALSDSRASAARYELRSSRIARRMDHQW